MRSPPTGLCVEENAPYLVLMYLLPFLCRPVLFVMFYPRVVPPLLIVSVYVGLFACALVLGGLCLLTACPAVVYMPLGFCVPVSQILSAPQPPPPPRIAQRRDTRSRKPPSITDHRQAFDVIHGLPPTPPPPPPPPLATTTAAAADHGDIKGAVLPPRPQNPQHLEETIGAVAGGGGAAHETPAGGKGGGGDGGDGFGAFPDPADGVDLALVYEGGRGGGLGGEAVVAEAGPMESFLERGEKFPVLLLTCNRAELLGQTIEVRVCRGYMYVL